MRRPDVPATKSNLLRLREHLSFVVAGHQLLDQKREVLLEALLEVHRDAGLLRRDADGALAGIYETMRRALLAAGHPALEAEALADAGAQRLAMRERSVMGVVVPLLELETREPAGPVTGTAATPPCAGEARRALRAVLPALVRLAEIEISCRRLAEELRKTQRKVNALEQVFIPEHRDTIRFIEGTLEERERESLFHMKRAKARRGRGGGEGEP